MTDLHIRRLRKRYRLAADSSLHVSRLDHVLRAAIDSELIEAALERAGIQRTDEICIRRASSATRLRDSDSDSRIATAWSMSIAEAIVEALRAGGPNVVRYGSSHQAISDMATSALRGEFSRSWAWTQLGMWHAGDRMTAYDAAFEIAAALIQHPCTAPAVLREVAKCGLLIKLVESLRADHWTQIARNASIAFARHDAFSTLGSQSAARDDVTDSVLQRILERSVILAAIAQSVRDVDTARAIAVLALLECEPGAVLQPPRIALIVSRILTAMIDVPDRSPRTRDKIDVPLNSVAPADDVDVVSKNNSVDVVSENNSDDSRPIPDRARARTEMGGLLFLLHIVGELDLTASPPAALNARSLQWTLHQLAMVVVPIHDRDPAALGFAGLSPSALPPTNGEPPPSDYEAAALNGMRSVVVDSLRERIQPPPTESDIDLLLRVASRRAEIVADPGWIEVHLDLSEVATDVRRAGLDLDPGWLPLLGVVVRFIYE